MATLASPSISETARAPKLEYTRPWMAPYQTSAIFEAMDTNRRPARYALIEATTKAGKTAGCLVWLMEKALQGQKNHNFWWVAPINTQADVAFNRMREGIPRILYTADLTHKKITLVNGAVIWFKSADNPDSLFGDDVHAAVIDEASRVKEEAWHAIRTTLTATKGPLRIIGNVKGRKNWFYALSRRAEKGQPGMSYHKMTAYDAIAAGVLDREEIEDARTQLPDHVFRELYLAEPSDDGGNPFGIAAIEACIKPLSTGSPRFWGWDLAKRQNWTVGIGLDAQGDACRFHRFQKPWDDTIEEIWRVVGGTRALVDSTGVGDPILEMLQKKPGNKFEGYTFNQSSKQKLMEGLAVKIQSQEIGYPEGPIASELMEFEYEYTKTGVRYSAPEGFEDDCVMALALAAYHMITRPAPIKARPDILQRVLASGGRNSGRIPHTRLG